jgi:16S rRNA (cytosine967-C5)-methyltransferase
MTAPARRAAYEALRAVGSGRALLAEAIVASREPLQDDRDRALVTTIVTGTLRWRNRLDFVLSRHVMRDLARLDPEVLEILRLSVFQLLFLERVPASAVVHDAVNLTRAAGKTSAAGFVNAVLRKISLTRDRLDLPQAPSPDAGATREAWLDALSLTGSHPRWLVERWLDRMGPEAAAAWVKFNNEEPALTIRANTLKTSRELLGERLLDAGVETERLRFAPDGLRVLRGNPLRTPLAKQGLFVVQDEASQLVALMCGRQQRWRTLDACAAPGGKTLVLASGPARGGLLVAADRRWRRLKLLREYLATAGASQARIAALDLSAGAPFRDIFDLVLVDAPCTGLGTLRREVDIRWRRSARHVEEAAAVQGRMLRNAANLVAPGGRLVYATCSSEPEENEGVFEAWLSGEPSFRPAGPESLSHDGVPSGLLDRQGYLHTRPDLHGLEAFFAAAADRARAR